jgi:hypothetical protein
MHALPPPAAQGSDWKRGEPMVGKITQTVPVVTNQTRSLEFFTEKVGFEKK